MKTHIHLAVVRLLSSVLCVTALSALASVPVRWTAETSRVQPIALDAWRGDTLALECTLKSYGRPVALGAATASLMWQTNGMGNAWWQTNATVSADGVIRATWSPSMDPGAPVVAFFLPVQTGDGASYRAAGTLRFRPSPGSGSQIAELPQPGGTLNFGEFNLVNAPWATLEAANEAISAAVTSATGALVIPPPVDLGPYATTGYVAGAVSSATGALVIPPPVDLTPYATTGSVTEAVQTASNALAGQIQAVSNAAMPRAEMGAYATQADVSTAISGIQIPSLAGYATQSYVVDYFATNYTPPDLSSYASRSYADAAASNAQAAAIAAIPSLAGYATQSYVANYVASNNTPPDLSSYASRSYADAAASNAQAAAIAAIPSLSGYATETYAQNAAESAASDALSAAQSYANDLSWAASQGNTRLVSLDGTTWQDATGTVWQVSGIFGWSGTVLDLPTTTASAIKFAPVPGSNDVWSAGGGTNISWDATGMQSFVLGIPTSSNAEYLVWADDYPPADATNITFTTSAEKYYLYYSLVALATNPVDRVLYASGAGDAATAERALTYGTPTRWTDATGCVWQVQDGYSPWMATTNIVTFLGWYQPSPETEPDLYVIHFAVNGTNANYYTTSSGATQTNELVAATEWFWYGWWGDDADAAKFDFSFIRHRIPGMYTNLVGRVALTNDIGGSIHEAVAETARAATNYTDALETELALGYKSVLSATHANSAYDARYLYDEDNAVQYNATDLIKASTNAAEAVAAPLQQDLANLRTESALVYRLYSGSNVVAEVTNYNSQVHAPSLRLLQLNESNEYVTVWTETNGLSRTLAAATNYTDDAISSRAAPRAWSGTTSGLGAEAPSNTTWISTPTTVIAGGFEYAKFVDTYGEVWVLTSNGMAAEFNPDTNAYFRITADDGTPIFSVEKSDAQLVGANASGITVGETTVTMQVPVVSATSPTMYWRESLTSGAWLDEMYPPMGATVSWSGTAGSWVCTVSFSGTRPSSMFFKFNFLQEGGVVIRNNATTDLSSGIWVNGVKFVPSVSGNNLIWTKQ